MAAGGGGAWKVAYADFVTAMMALFLLLWILNQDEKIKGAVQKHFLTRFNAETRESPGIIPADFAELVKSRRDIFENASVIPLEHVRIINEDLVKVFIENPSYLDLKTMQVSRTDDGLLINILNNPDKPIFAEGEEDKLTEYGKVVFNTIAWQIARYEDTEVEVEGHTSRDFISRDANDKWIVATKRAHRARQVLVDKGVKDSQVIKVSGYGDTQPLEGQPKNASQNNRVSIRVRARQEKTEP